MSKTKYRVEIHHGQSREFATKAKAFAYVEQELDLGVIADELKCGTLMIYDEADVPDGGLADMGYVTPVAIVYPATP